MAHAHETGNAVTRYTTLTIRSRGQRRKIAGRHVDVTTVESIGKLRIYERDGPHLAFRSVTAEMLDDGSEKGKLGDVGNGNGDRPRTRFRIEGFVSDQVVF